MKIIVPVIVGICAIFLGYFTNSFVNFSGSSKLSLTELNIAQRAVERNIKLLSDDIIKKLDAFAQTVSDDRIFTLRLLAEQDRSSPDVTGFAARFLKPMGFSTLDIADSSLVIVSSGQFTANAGSDASEKASIVGATPAVVSDNVMGKDVLTFQAKKEFRIADIPFYVLGGCNIDKALLTRLSPFDGCTVMMRIGNEIFGMDSIHSASEIKENIMIINDKEYFAASVAIPSAQQGNAPEILVAIEK